MSAVLDILPDVDSVETNGFPNELYIGQHKDGKLHLVVQVSIADPSGPMILDFLAVSDTQEEIDSIIKNLYVGDVSLEILSVTLDEAYAIAKAKPHINGLALYKGGVPTKLYYTN